jgi:hypothetical protein
VPSRWRLLVPPLVLVGIGVLIVGFLWPDGPVRSFRIGLLLGTFFGHTSASAGWSSLGPGSVRLRVPLSLVWIGLLLGGLTIQASIHGSLEVVGMIGACLLGQWILIQFPLLLLRWTHGLRLVHRDEQVPALTRGAAQFGIRQLMIFTTVVAIVLGIGRVLVPIWIQHYPMGEFVIFGLLGITIVVLTLPLVIASLLSKFSIPAVGGVLVLTAMATWWEATLFRTLRVGGPGFDDFVRINVFTSAWLLAFAIHIRLCGYSLATAVRKPATPDQ